MTKKKTAATASTKSVPAPTDPAEITVFYDLFQLPTAQHKAGLAGLLMQIDSMRNREIEAPSYVMDETRKKTVVHVTFTQKTTIALFNDVYDAKPLDVLVKKPWKGVDILREETVTVENKNGEKKQEVRFVHSVVQPVLPFLRHRLSDSGKEIWLKLWRDMLWSIPRANPQTRTPYKQCAEGISTEEGAKSWKSLVDFTKHVEKGKTKVDEVSGCLLLGAQAQNAERVPFEGRVEQTLLLHFWHLTTMVYAPRIVKRDKGGEYKVAHEGVALAIPEVSDLERFPKQYKQVLSRLSNKKAGYRPAEAVIDLPAEGALSFMTHLAVLAEQAASSAETSRSIAGMEFLHLVKAGNNVKTMTSGRIDPREDLWERYRHLSGGQNQRPNYRNPLFRRCVIIALLEEIPWYQPFGRPLVQCSADLFIPSDKSPPKISWFWADASRKFKEIQKAMTNPPDPESVREDDKLADAINRFTRRYLDERLKAETDVDFAALRKARKAPSPDVAEKRTKLAERLFLEFRSRNDQAFISHFTATFCRVPQYMGRDFEKIASSLLNNPDKIKTLTLLALSANSYVFMPQTKENAL